MNRIICYQNNHYNKAIMVLVIEAISVKTIHNHSILAIVRMLPSQAELNKLIINGRSE